MLRDAWDHVHPCCLDMPLLLPGSSDESGPQVDNVNEGVIRSVPQSSSSVLFESSFWLKFRDPKSERHTAFTA